MIARLAALSIALLCVAASAVAQTSRPAPAATPGALNPSVSQATIASTICIPSWAHSIRPPSRATTRIKRQQLAAYGWPGGMRAYEEDHLVPLELGGSPDSVLNLWPEPRHPADGWTAARKDRLEDVLHQLVCRRRLPLIRAQAAIATDWEEAYRAYVVVRR